jgi:hypothetical protein
MINHGPSADSVSAAGRGCDRAGAAAWEAHVRLPGSGSGLKFTGARHSHITDFLFSCDFLHSELFRIVSQ